MLNFKPIKGHPSYLISADGVVINTKTNRKLKRSISGTGYYTCYVDGRNELLHRLIAETFLPNPNNKRCVNHINGDKTDNRIENLEWCTYGENNAHAYRSGLKQHAFAFGERSRHHKLSETDVEYIKTTYVKYDKLCGGRALAKQFGVTEACVSAIIRGVNWVGEAV